MEAGVGNGPQRLTYRAALARDLGMWCSGAQGQHSCAIIQSEEERVKGLEGVFRHVTRRDIISSAPNPPWLRQSVVNILWCWNRLIVFDIQLVEFNHITRTFTLDIPTRPSWLWNI